MRRDSRPALPHLPSASPACPVSVSHRLVLPCVSSLYVKAIAADRSRPTAIGHARGPIRARTAMHPLYPSMLDAPPPYRYHMSVRTYRPRRM